MKGLVVKTKNFFSEVGAEMKKVTWPTPEEIRGSTMVVLISMLILSVFIGVADFILSHLVKLLLR